MESTQAHNIVLDTDEAAAEAGEAPNPSLPATKVKRIMKLDGEVNKVSGEAVHLVAAAAEIFVAVFAGRAREAAACKKRRVIKVEHVRAAARGHRPTADFLLDCLPRADVEAEVAVVRKEGKKAPVGARRIDEIFGRSKMG